MTGAVTVPDAHRLENGSKTQGSYLGPYLGSGVSVDLYIIAGRVSLLHINSMVNHNSQQCREHKNFHNPLHLAEGIGISNNYNMPEC